MPKLTLSRPEAERLVKFCADNKLAQWFIAKDQGAYLGASTGAKPEQQCLFYFKGCNPRTDADWYDTAHSKFGGDDFGEHMGIEAITKPLAHPGVQKIEINITRTRLSVQGLR
jgi:hypothetical protein